MSAAMFGDFAETGVIFSAAVETVVNRVLAMDEESRTKLARFEDRLLGIELQGLDLRVFFTVAGDRFRVLSRCDAPCDAMIRGTPLALLRLSLSGENKSVLKGEVTLEGDTQLAQAFQRFLAELDPDWEEALAQVSNDLFAHKAAVLIRGLRAWGQDAASVVQQDIADYLQVESGLNPVQEEVQPFLSAVDELRSDVERLTARIHRLQEALNN